MFHAGVTESFFHRGIVHQDIDAALAELRSALLVFFDYDKDSFALRISRTRCEPTRPEPQIIK